MGSKGGSTTVPAQITTAVKGVFINAVKAYAGPVTTNIADLNLDQFISMVTTESQNEHLSNVGHPNYKPFMLRRYGERQGAIVPNTLAYDTVTGKWQAYLLLQESINIVATGEITLVDSWQIEVGDTIAIDDLSMGVRNLFLIEGKDETPKEIKFSLIDVIGG